MDDFQTQYAEDMSDPVIQEVFVPVQGSFDAPVLSPAASAPISGAERKKGGRTFLIGLAMLALVALGCVITAFVVNRFWENKQALAAEQTQQQLDQLSQQIRELEQSQQNTIIRPSGSPAGNGAQSGNSAPVPEGYLSTVEIYDYCVSSVVAISNRVSGRGGAVTEAGTGSGFILTQDGYIVSNHHVVEDADVLVVIMGNGTEYEAELIGSDATSDVALLKVEAAGLPAANIGSSGQLKVGEQVVAIGNPLGELTATQTVGYVSGKDRAVSTDGTVMNMIQTDAAINPGNSGGPLFNMYGQVVGITTAKYSGTTSSGATIEGIGFAIPIDDVIGMLEDMKDYGYVTGGYLGVTVTNLDPQRLAANGIPMGVYVMEVSKGGCADAAGVKADDILTELGGYRIQTINDLTRALRNFKAGDTVTITVYRGGESITLTGVLGEKPVPGQEAVPQENVEQVPLPEDGSYEEWYNYFSPFFGEE